MFYAHFNMGRHYICRYFTSSAIIIMPKILMQFFSLDDMHNQYKLAEIKFTEKKWKICCTTQCHVDT
jgi:hypothetical protein